ncbi:MAG: 2-phospho-L-lactate guanylyltransferase [Actinomycetota bacterium]
MRAIVLPVKSLDETKARLRSVLAPMERAALTLAMLEDVLDAALTVPGWETWVISPDESVLEVAAIRGAVTLVEDEPPLGQAIRQVEDEAEARGADALAVLLPDTPLVTTAVLTRTVHTLGPVVIAPAADERGTNLLLRRPPTAIAAHFGPDSFRRHVEAAAEADLPLAVTERPELAFDLDAPDDILTVLRSSRPTRTRAVLQDLGADERLDTRASGT